MTPPTHPLQEGGFDPLAMLRRAPNDGDDIPSIKLRMLWLRQRVPEARVETSVVTLDDNVVVMAATIALPDGGEGSGHAAVRRIEGDDIAALIETTELRAIGRALDIIGYVVVDQQGGQIAPERAEREPVDREPTPITRERPDRAGQEEPSRPEPASEDQPQGPATPPGHVQAIRSLRDRGTRDTAPQRPEPIPAPRQDRPTQRPEQQQSPSVSDAEPELEDVSWTAFWNWARGSYQLSSRVQLEELLGQSIGPKTPGQVRQLLLEHFSSEKTD
ncbi:MAG TPA: hypothetical protein VGR22_06330 [Thermomicrobiales bacterium]|nr:hypothetical protein [Thermomicrobiales bacterium]